MLLAGAHVVFCPISSMVATSITSNEPSVTALGGFLRKSGQNNSLKVF